MSALRLSKHHGLGNDFLVLVDAAGRTALTEAMARAVCHRTRGVGADGLLRATSGPADGSADLTMELRNADGSVAEMSGNGIACLVQAAVADGAASGPDVRVLTAGGLRTVSLAPGTSSREAVATVEMGMAKVQESGRGLLVDMGNPHLVLLDQVGLDLVALGTANPDVNVEVVTVEGDGSLSMRVHERGVGITEACGTGACASAVAARHWGLVGDQVVVHQPGGDTAVGLDGEAVTYTVTVHRTATVEVPWP